MVLGALLFVVGMVVLVHGAYSALAEGADAGNVGVACFGGLLCVLACGVFAHMREREAQDTRWLGEQAGGNGVEIGLRADGAVVWRERQDRNGQ